MGEAALAQILDLENEVFVSVASLWELVVKRRVGKLHLDPERLFAAMPPTGFRLLAIEPRHLSRLAVLPMHHRDPFDHLLIAQALADDLTFVSDERHVPLYSVRYVQCSGAER